MKAGAVRAWRVVHTWTSLACTLFLLVLCLTGLPLVFRAEIEGATRRAPPFAAAVEGAHADLGRIAAAARATRPGEFVRTVYAGADPREIGVILTPAADGPFKPFHTLFFDSRTGALRLDDAAASPATPVMDWLKRAHVDLLTGPPGEIFLGLMALVFLASVVSGAALYAPFMRKLEFGTVRRGGSGRLAWLDLHNLVGVTTLTWMLVVGATGALNAFAAPLFGLWNATTLQPALHARADAPTAPAAADLQRVVDAAHAAAPGGALDFVTAPSRFVGSPRHYVVWFKGDRTLTSRLRTPVMVDAVTGRVALAARTPWYLRAVEVSRPLHFGDYGGLWLKALWAGLDLLTLGLLATGLYLWVAKRRWSVRAPELIEAEAVALTDAPA